MIEVIKAIGQWKSSGLFVSWRSAAKIGDGPPGLAQRVGEICEGPDWISNLEILLSIRIFLSFPCFLQLISQ
jgi:hypothetical protein